MKETLDKLDYYLMKMLVLRTFDVVNVSYRHFHFVNLRKEEEKAIFLFYIRGYVIDNLLRGSVIEWQKTFSRFIRKKRGENKN